MSQTAQGLDPLAGKIRPGRGKMDEQIAGGPYMNPFERAYERYMVTGVKINPLSGVAIVLGGYLFIVFYMYGG